MPKFPDKQNIVTHTAELLTVAVRRHLSESPVDDIANVNVAARLDHVAGNLLVDLRARVAATHTDHAVTESVSVPADWWQAVRERWLPAWWLGRWPVQMRRIAISHEHRHYRVCPHVRVPDNARHLQWLAIGDCAPTPGEGS